MFKTTYRCAECGDVMKISSIQAKEDGGSVKEIQVFFIPGKCSCMVQERYAVENGDDIPASCDRCGQTVSIGDLHVRTVSKLNNKVCAELVCSDCEVMR